MLKIKFKHNLLLTLNLVTRSSVGRYSLAIIFSVLLHIIFLWFPDIRLSHDNVVVPDISVRLEALPKTVIKSESVDIGSVKIQTESEAAQSDLRPLPGRVIKNVLKMQHMETSAEHLPIPAHLKIVFKLYDSDSNYSIGKVIHQLDLHNDQYILQSERYIDRLSSLVKGDQFTQLSSGVFGEKGFKPEIYKSVKINSGLTENRKVLFNWLAHKLDYSNNPAEMLPEDAQDMLSYLYQFSQISMQREIISFPISDGTHLVKHEMEIGRTEQISTPMGVLSALHLRKIHQMGEPYFEVWLALDYRMLPVMYRQVDASGVVIAKYAISEILVADESK